MLKPTAAAKEPKKETKEDKERYDGPIICPGHSRPIPDLAYSQVTADGYFLASACLDGKPMLREGSTGDWIGTLVGHKGAVWSIRFNSIATRAITGSADFSAKIWDAITGKEVHSFTHKHIVKAIEFSQDSLSVYSGGQEKKLRIFDLEKPDAEPQVCLGHAGAITHIGVPSDPHLIFSASSEEKSIRVWDRRTLATVKSLECPALLTSFQVSIEGGTLAAAAGQHVSFWDTKSLSVLKSVKLSRPIDTVAYHPAAKFFVTGGGSELWARAYDFASGEEIAVNKGHHGPVRCLAFNPAGDAYASGSVDGTIRIWEWLREKQNKDKEKEIPKSEVGAETAGAEEEAEEVGGGGDDEGPHETTTTT